MSSILSSQGVVLATAMAVSGTVILLALRLQKPPSSSTALFSLQQSCIISSSEDVVDPIGNSEDYRKLHKKYSNSTTLNKARKLQEMPANRVALYNGILRERVIHHRVAYSC
ncbi:hypothetical protein C2S51_031486 [Perilla frutescens var. frutescens]|nr:hypothetical protein C2S51_031486 [Perilla frutescens var. frutescens]